MTPQEIVARQKRHHATGATTGLDARRRALRGLMDATVRHERALLDALDSDLGKGEVEAFISEIQMVRGECRHALDHLAAWMKPSRRRGPALAWPASTRVVREPAGTVLILGPWNYPVQLLLSPLFAALAGGNCAVLKPSELAPATARAISAMIVDAFDPGHVAVISGDASVAEALQQEKFDHVFFTGGTATGKKVMAAAAEHLTPVTLELGGKCPALVFPGDDGRHLDTIARRIAWGKHLNAGQTCVAPDHVLVDRRWHDPLVAALGRAFDSFAGGEYGRIVNRRHFDRLEGYLRDGHVAYGGRPDPERLHFPPVVLTGIPPGAAVMEEEIFGPVLPVIPCEGPEEALSRVAGAPSPLAVYLFTGDRDLVHRTAAATRSGGLCVNDVVVHITGNELPFGGTGDSGMGRYRGKAGFDTFTRERVIMRRPLWPDLPFRYPSAKQSLAALKKLPRFLTGG